VLADDPRLLPEPAVGRPFFRVVLDSRLRLPSGSRLARSAKRSPVIVLASRCPAARKRELARLGVHVVCAPRPKGRVDLRWALQALFGLGIASVMVEGGAEVLGSFLRARLLDKVTLFRAPLLLGGRRGRGAFGGPDPLRLAEALRLAPVAPSWVDAREVAADPQKLAVEHWYPAR
jgi:diaminohydroxyphosphoribosylaminopyrimidine deaminase/5-amino-6-(5-phosphoribosylamino)uracil reductase